jgi:hypothetical protein
LGNILEHVFQLGSDEFMGRGTGTAGETMAAEYIANQLQTYGLIPIGDKSTFYQKIPMHGSSPSPLSQFIISLDTIEKNIDLGKDYLLYNTGEETFIPNPTPLVFVGYGIIAPEYDYNDYLSVDVDGKVVVFLSGEPYSADPYYFNGSKPTIYSYPESKQRIAISRGAKGSIMIPVTKDIENYDWDYWVQQFAFEHITLAYTVTNHMSALLNPSLADSLFLGSLMTYERVVEMHEKGKLSSFPLNSQISFSGEFEERDFVGQNIVAMVEGGDSELNDTYVIVSAHYDHLGIGPPVKGDSIYNGVLDNALGVAALIEISRNFAIADLKPKRSIIFIFLTGEEKGLLGSTYYTDHPVRPLYKTVAAINIDGVAAFEEFKDIIGIGAELSSLKNDLHKVAASQGLKVSSIPENYFYESESISRSDQFSFIKAGIPSILITEGVSYKNTSYEKGIMRLIQWSKNVYHSPFDDLNQPLNFMATLQHTKLIYEFVSRIANKEKPPHWIPGSPYINARLQSIAEKR